MNEAISGDFVILSAPRFVAAKSRKRLLRGPTASLATLRFDAEAMCPDMGVQDVLDARVDGVLAERWHDVQLGMIVTATGFLRPRDPHEMCFGEPFVVRDITDARMGRPSSSPLREFRW
ncbi:hypothetical protein GCM10025867_49390 (plasmid) [Frondihabitans sucicola]|uniref:Uncharacterized protein n=1 Tax=Frondihabitans sucicola TaxID=1268041 RepID=A0ABM8GW46_9MICO|nr:hypothetical protein [Frondihabitans sucicola]BDZ52698.1 hypothetical protein GCM10025867_49390 [Frondihabitans sucicola]